ncbi:MAG: hypothetical protein FJX03_02930 [Alphaproteobacteria bacterium]|nr:hypothetical protein [Alphaproteobacteria bacterium]
MVYGFGKWNKLLNTQCIIPHWGLRVIVSTAGNPDKIKGVNATHYRTTNPFTKREKTPKLVKIENFGIEVGSEDLNSLSSFPNKSYKTKNIILGRDFLKFTFKLNATP